MARNRGDFFRELHQKAKSRREIYKKYYEDKPTPKYSEFLKNENPIDKQIVVYEVSYQVSYKSQDSSLMMDSAETFYVYAIREFETEDMIYHRTKDMILDMKGSNTNAGLNDRTREYFNDNPQYLNIKVEPRGMEKVDKKVLNNNNYNRLLQNSFVVENLDSTISLKNKKGKTAFKQKLNVNHFM